MFVLTHREVLGGCETLAAKFGVHDFKDKPMMSNKSSTSKDDERAELLRLQLAVAKIHEVCAYTHDDAHTRCGNLQ